MADTKKAPAKGKKDSGRITSGDADSFQIIPPKKAPAKGAATPARPQPKKKS